MDNYYNSDDLKKFGNIVDFKRKWAKNLGYYGEVFKEGVQPEKIIDCFGSIPCCSMPVLHRFTALMLMKRI
jgi:hypothetical protein